MMTFTAICLVFRILGAIAALFVMQGGGDVCLLLLDFRGSEIYSTLFGFPVNLSFLCLFEKSYLPSASVVSLVTRL
jgi:hypothetical protein